MTFKRRNGGAGTSMAAATIRAIKRFLVRNIIVEQAAVRDVQEACVYELEPTLCRSFMQRRSMLYCVSCSIHSHVVRVRSCTDRRNRAPPQRSRDVVRINQGLVSLDSPDRHPALQVLLPRLPEFELHHPSSYLYQVASFLFWRNLLAISNFIFRTVHWLGF